MGSSCNHLNLLAPGTSLLPSLLPSTSISEALAIFEFARRRSLSPLQLPDLSRRRLGGARDRRLRGTAAVAPSQRSPSPSQPSGFT
ncbi:hypothetical protein NL676_036668 [Syzygium grande]|nr:hypothetical protein NL676_036668 [Syzygium grande]